jgi:L-ascorbate metabolism protein UlaG (beta-lactamase superfamily)
MVKRASAPQSNKTAGLPMNTHLLKYIGIMAVAFPLLISAQIDTRITYVANEGFLIEASSKKILVDALFGGFEGTWCEKPSVEVKSKLENADPPFDSIDIIAITHWHVDHFNEAMVVNHVIHNPNVIILCPKQVEVILMKNLDFRKISRNILAYTPAVGKDTVVRVRDVSVRILRLEHGPYIETDEKTGKKVNRHQDVENLGFLFEINGMKIFHSGDSNSRGYELYKSYREVFKGLDIAFLDRTFIYSEQAEGIEIIEKILIPHDVVFMHVEPNASQKYRDIAARVTKRIQNVFIFDKPMEKRVFSQVRHK